MISLSIITSTDDFYYFFSDSSSSSDEEGVQQSLPASTPVVVSLAPITTTRTPKVKKPISKVPKPILHVKNIGGKKSQGHRQARRHENSLLMIIILPLNINHIQF